MRLVLASASPRRRDLLSRLGLPFRVVPPETEEDLAPGGGRAERLARRLAAAKAGAIAAAHPQALILAADTIVVHRGRLLGKPRDATEAEAMLGRLRGRRHRVITGVAVLAPGRRRPYVDYAVTSVIMRRYSEAEVAASVARGDPFDKAGAYAIQDDALRPVESWEGCYCNVVGLPLWTVVRLLAGSGLRVDPAPERPLPPCASCPLRPSVTEAG
ncbi:MAG: septum formation protein Maf [Chloroflexi bacterium]|nr:septum formation protein Maf [Chloroflexota bacterium]